MSIKVNNQYDYENRSELYNKDSVYKTNMNSDEKSNNEYKKANTNDKHDEYIHGEDTKPTGLYKLGRDSNGKPKILYDDPKKAQNADDSDKKQPKADDTGKKQPKADGADDTREYTVNTNKVDREIKKLKEEKKQLEQQLSAAQGDDKKVKELQIKILQIESELNQKDNDTYRRQNSIVY